MTNLYDIDIQDVFVETDINAKPKLHIVYYVPVEEGVFTREDLERLLGMFEEA